MAFTFIRIVLYEYINLLTHAQYESACSHRRRLRRMRGTHQRVPMAEACLRMRGRQQLSEQFEQEGGHVARVLGECIIFETNNVDQRLIYRCLIHLTGLQYALVTSKT